MRVLLDSCIWAGAQESILAAGHEAARVGNWESDPGDEEVLARALDAGCVLVTLDKDFGELAIVRGAPHAGIVRLVGLSAREQGPAVVEVLRVYAAELAQRAILTVTKDRVRVRAGG